MIVPYPKKTSSNPVKNVHMTRVNISLFCDSRPYKNPIAPSSAVVMGTYCAVKTIKLPQNSVSRSALGSKTME